jgi:hypothetical protein
MSASLNRTAINWPGLIGSAILGALLSFVYSGFVFGISNNLFHLGIMAEHYTLPQFQDDAFNQSLRHFASGFWLLLRGSADHINPDPLFFMLHFASRWLCFFGFLLAASTLGIATFVQQLLFATLLALTSLMRGFSAAGDGGLFFNSFTHSEIANGLTMIILYFCVRSRLHLAIATNGVVFFVNAFIAFWNTFPLIVFLLANARAILRSPSDILKLGTAGLIFLIIALPVAAMIASNPDSIQGDGPTYAEFLRFYYPNHFFWQANGLRGNLALVLIVTLGFGALFYLGDAGRKFQIALLSFCILYIIGVVAPAITDSRLVLNLHLLRSSTNIQMISALALIALTTKWVTSQRALDRNLYGPVLAVVLCLPKSALVVALVCVVTRPFTRGLQFDFRWLRPMAALGIALYSFVSARAIDAENTKLAAATVEWRQIALWARAHTPPQAKFLLPVVNPHKTEVKGDLSKGAGSEVFEYYSQRSAWVDFKRGAAAMWAPSYLPEWRQRISEAIALQDLDAKLGYARAHNIQFVVQDCSTTDLTPLFRTAHLCVFAAAPQKTSSQHLDRSTLNPSRRHTESASPDRS